MLLWTHVLAASLLFHHEAAAPAAVNTVPRTDIVIDIGHGGVDGGTSYGKIVEKDINLAVGLRLYPLLQSRHVSASINRTKDYALSDDNPSRRGNRYRRDLAQRVEIVNKLEPAFMLSLHVNWASNKMRSGPLVIYRKNSEPGRRLAARLQKELNGLYGTTTQPEPSRQYYVLTHTEIPTVIVEMGFLSNAHDRKLLTSPNFQQKLAQAISKGALTTLQEDFKSRPAGKRK
ncbi:MAG: hypothetical protein K0R57_6520 [Paenibacillaceae bacterium]|jgi:N-acetylmuramoyl-L-alanine amidase|nr:hypothetical protein [Paenibacillaceae bacterium]